MYLYDTLELIQGDITNITADVIVNAANESLLGGGGVDGAIHLAAGPELLKACEKIGGCKTGEIAVTPAFNLNAKYVFHAVGPIYGEHDGAEARLLASVYEKSLQEAQDRKLDSIAFPAISTGAYGYPPEEAAALIAKTLHDWLLVENMIEGFHHIKKVYVVLFDKEMYDIFDRAFKTTFNSQQSQN